MRAGGFDAGDHERGCDGGDDDGGRTGEGDGGSDACKAGVAAGGAVEMREGGGGYVGTGRGGGEGVGGAGRKFGQGRWDGG